MAEYIPPSKSNIPFHFSTGGYTSPDFENLSLNFSVKQIQSAMSDLKASIQVFDTKYETYTYLKYCERYIVGYTSAGVQIIKGKCFYGGIRDVGGFIRAVAASHFDLGAEIFGKNKEVDLPAYIDTHLPEDLSAIIRVMLYRDLTAYLSGVFSYDLPAYIYSVVPYDLHAKIIGYIPPDLHANIHGWQEQDLGATIYRRFKSDLGGWIGANNVVTKLNAIIKGWVRGAYKDLSTYVKGYDERFLSGFIRGTEYKDLSAQMVYIQPVDIKAQIHGWQISNLLATLIGDDYLWNLPASINITGEIRNISAFIGSVVGADITRDLSASILGTRGRQDLSAFTHAIQYYNLGAILNSGTDYHDLGAHILPKRIMLTGILSVITLNHRDLSAIINASCFGSEFRDLNSYINLVYLRDLNASLKGIVGSSTSDLTASFGFEDMYYTIDKLPISIYSYKSDYRVEDRLLLTLQLYRESRGLFASIIGVFHENNLSASIYGDSIPTLGFTHSKNKEKVFHRDHYGQVSDFQDIYITFSDIIEEYFFNAFSGNAWSSDKESYWLTEVSSYYSEATSAELRRRLHKLITLYDLRNFKSIDTAIKYAIDYVSTDFYSDIGATIESIGHTYDLSATLNIRNLASASNNLTSNIVGSI